MFALVHARSNAPNENVVGSPILEFAQSASVRNAVAAMNNSGSTAETQKSEIATTSGHECRRDRQPVSLLPEGAVTGAEGDDDVAAGGRAGHAHWQPEACSRSEVEGEESGGAARAGLESRNHDPRCTRQLERPAPAHDGERLRDDRGKRRRPLSHVPRRT